MSLELENLILACTVNRQEYSNKVYPHLKEKFFEGEAQRTLFSVIQKYQEKYLTFPTPEAIVVDLDNSVGNSQEVIEEAKNLSTKIFSSEVSNTLRDQNIDWLLDTTLKHLQNRSCYLAVMESLSIIEGQNKKLDKGAIPDIMRDALSISFDNDIGHDYIDNAEERFEYYHKKENKIPFSLSLLNKITNGGPTKKALIVPLAPTGVGKTLFLCNEAAHWLSDGRNVLYITLEMAEEKIAERIDANLMNINLNELKETPKDTFLSKIKKMQKNTVGKLIIKEYPPGTFHSNNLRFLLKDLSAKRNFKPDIVIVDYLSLLASYRMKSADQTYTYVKAVTEELRGVMLEYDMLGVAPTQTNRDGQNSADFELNQMSESHGVSMTADMIFGLISIPELEKIGRLRIKQLKNRFGALDYYNSFVVGINRSKMKLFDVDVEVEDQPKTVDTIPNINKGNTDFKGLKF